MFCANCGLKLGGRFSVLATMGILANPKTGALHMRTSHPVRLVLASALCAAALSASGQSAPAARVDVAGIKYEQSINLGGQELVLNGAGIRYRAIFKVYTAGLYLGAKANTAEAVLAAARTLRGA